jgi:DNA repair protein RecN (Recombination protein N)
MLQKISIKNFALIDDLNVDFNTDFTIITGETGAGKSILLGGLGLILGKRADLSVLKNSEKKCTIEGEFFIKQYNLTSFFEENDLDFEELSIIRREILPNGKSRAFVNDTPVKLNILAELGEKLIDIHSQHQTLQMADAGFQFKILDALANNINYLDSYKRGLTLYGKLNKELNELLKTNQEAKQQYDYNLFLLNELNDATLKIDEQEFLEEILAKLNNIESIKQCFVEALNTANNDQFGIKLSLHSFKNNVAKLASISKDYDNLFERINSLDIEFDDIANELERANDEITISPQEIENYNDRLSLIYSLQKKHNVSSIAELLEIQESFSLKIDNVNNASQILESKKNETDKVESQLNKLAVDLHNSRLKVIPDLKNQLESTLAVLAMKNTRFKIELTKGDTFLSNGKDELQILISANKGSNFESLKKVASGGEMSRIMLSVKALLSKHINLPTIIFDEIDTGVSGEVANKMATIMKRMSDKMQVISITHLPQIAAKGKYHFKVFKQEINNKTITDIKLLNDRERIKELAEMLGGKDIAKSAIEHAKQLLS